MKFLEPLLCLDLGNTTCRGGIWDGNKIIRERTLTTKEFCLNAKKWLDAWHHHGNISYCSVVPEAEEVLTSIYSDNVSCKLFGLTSQNQTFLPISYPHPEEIGSDRIANSYAVFKKYSLPAIVIDLGTATTFDVILGKEGYIGGVIVPGPQGMLDYLANKTALLPKLDLKQEERIVPAIGKSTNTAMMSGLCYGYMPMLNGIIQAISKEITISSQSSLSIIQTGGEAKNFLVRGSILHNSLTLEGLALAYLNEQSQI